MKDADMSRHARSIPHVLDSVSLCVLILAFFLAGQPATATEVPFAAGSALDSAFDGASAVCAADVDGDGDIDIIGAASTANTVAWYENDGSATPSFTGNDVDTTFNGASAVCAADVDDDGDIDIIAAASTANTVAWYENDGGATPSFTDNHIDTAFNGASAVWAADVDCDGDIDIIAAASTDNTVTWYENDGGATPSFTDNHIDTAFNGASAVWAADVDDDGDIDIIAAASTDNTVAWYENDGGATPSFTDNHIDTAFNGASAVWAADVDGDGDIDIIGAANTDNHVAWWENDNGDGSSWSDHDVDTTFNGASAVWAADVDGDGDIDIIGAAYGDNDIAWYENDGGATPSFTDHDVNTTFNGASAVCAADVDDDGDMDVVGTASDADTVAWYDNQTIHRNATFPEQSVISDAATGTRSIFAADVDGDGDMDVLSAWYLDDTVAWHESDGGATPSFTTRTISTGALGVYSVLAADVDGDGNMDILSASRSDDTVAWYENDGASPPSFTARTISTTALGATSVFAADVDGDGNMDALSASYSDDTIAWYENDGASPPSFTARTITTTADVAVSVFAADVDGDGDMDVLSASYSDDTIAWYENDGASPPSFTARTISTTADGAWSVFATDVDRDGDIDVLSASYLDDTVAWYENDGGSPPSFTARTVSTIADGATSALAADMDGDGDIDIVAGSNRDDTVAWYENDGATPPSFTARTIYNAADGTYSVYAVDVDGDGDTDALSGSGSDDTVAWYENKGGQFALATIDTAPATLVEGQIDDTLAIVPTHNGRTGDTDMELTTFELLFEESAADPLSSAEANALVENLFVYLDDGSGVFGAGSDTLVATLDALSLTAGVQTVTFSDGDANVQVAFSATRTYFAVVQIAADAASQTPNSFLVTHLTETSSTGEDRDNDIPLSLEYADNVSSGTVTAQPLTVAFSSTSSNGAESSSPVNTPVALSDTTDVTVTVDYAATGGTAAGGGTDYTLTSGTLTFDPGETTRNISIIVVNDGLDESNETIVVTLSDPSNASLGANSQHTYTIIDNDTTPFFAGATLAPDPVYETTTLSVICTGWSDVDGDPPGYLYQWRRDSADIPAATNPTLTGADFDKGDSITCSVTAWDGWNEGNRIETAAVVISNSAPSFVAASITPDPAHDTSALSVICTGWSDADGDPPGYLYQWRKNSADIPGATDPTLTEANFDSGDSITCVVTAWDGTESGNSVETSPVLVEPMVPATGVFGITALALSLLGIAAASASRSPRRK